MEKKNEGKEKMRAVKLQVTFLARKKKMSRKFLKEKEIVFRIIRINRKISNRKTSGENSMLVKWDKEVSHIKSRGEKSIPLDVIINKRTLIWLIQWSYFFKQYKNENRFVNISYHSTMKVIRKDWRKHTYSKICLWEVELAEKKIPFPQILIFRYNLNQSVTILLVKKIFMYIYLRYDACPINAVDRWKE